MRGFALLPCLFTMSLLAQAKDPALQTDDQKVLYALGANIGKQTTPFDLSADEIKFVTMGFQDSVHGKKLKVDTARYTATINALKKKRQLARSATFLQKAAKKKGGRKFDSGLIVTRLKKGKGSSPKATDRVKVHYHGTLPDGTVFDSSVRRGQPSTFPLNGVIKCWTEGVQKIKVGGKAELICPPHIAYGDRGAPPSIPGGAVLIFEIELLEILK